MDYGEIISSAFKVAWRNKTLWILGLFAAGFSNFSDSFDFPFRGEIESTDFQILGYTIDFHNFAESNLWILIAIASLLVIYFLIFLILHCICTPALIDAVNRLTRGGVYRLRDSFSAGLDYFWRYIGLNILVIMIGIVGSVALIGPVVLLFIIAVPLGVLSLFPLIPLFFFFIYALSTISTLGERAMVIRNINITDALAEGMDLFWKNKIHSLIIFLLYLALTIGIALGLLAVFGLMSVPFIFIASASTTGLIMALAIGLPLLMILMLPISGFLGTAFEAMYTIFYIRLVEPQKTTNSPEQTSSS
jgi:hypothetical protein